MNESNQESVRIWKKSIQTNDMRPPAWMGNFGGENEEQEK